MTSQDADRPELAPEDEALVERIAELYPRAELDPARRVAFQTELDRRLQRGRSLTWKPLAAGLVAAAAAALILWAPRDGPTPEPTTTLAEGAREPVEAVTPEEALLALATPLEGEPDEALPDDYEAIASLLWGS